MTSAIEIRFFKYIFNNDQRNPVHFESIDCFQRKVLVSGHCDKFWKNLKKILNWQARIGYFWEICIIVILLVRKGSLEHFLHAQTCTTSYVHLKIHPQKESKYFIIIELVKDMMSTNRRDNTCLAIYKGGTLDVMHICLVNTLFNSVWTSRFWMNSKWN